VKEEEEEEEEKKKKKKEKQEALGITDRLLYCTLCGPRRKKKQG
jgi:hypothetical protein